MFYSWQCFCLFVKTKRKTIRNKCTHSSITTSYYTSTLFHCAYRKIRQLPTIFCDGIATEFIFVLWHILPKITIVCDDVWDFYYKLKTQIKCVSKQNNKQQQQQQQRQKANDVDNDDDDKKKHINLSKTHLMCSRQSVSCFGFCKQRRLWKTRSRKQKLVPLRFCWLLFNHLIIISQASFALLKLRQPHQMSFLWCADANIIS